MEKTLEKLQELLEKELDKITAKGNVTPPELESATKAVCLIEKIKAVQEMDFDDSYSRGNMPYSNRSYNGSFRRMRSNDSYMGNGDYYNQDRNYDYSIERGYSGHSVKDRMIAQLETTMMDSAQSESERRVIESLISKLGSSNY